VQTEPGVISHNVSRKRYLESLKLFSVMQQKKSREYTTLILTFAAIAIFGLFAINPTLTTIVQLQKQLEDSKTLDGQLEEKIQNLQTLQNEYTELEPDLQYVESAIPESPQTPVFIGQVQALIKKHNLAIELIKTENIPYTKDTGEAGKMNSYVVSYSVTGNYTDIKAFADEAVIFDRLVTVDNLTVSRDQQDPAIIRGAAEIRAYYDQLAL
jgi:Tfp pilus assembly protein PilO